MRKRLREWPTIAYKYRAYPREIPQQMWDTAREMRRVWNALIVLREQAFTDTKEIEKTAKKERWKQFWADAKVSIAASALNWECKSEVFDRFETASKMAAKKGATLHTHSYLDRVAIPHRFTGGGLPIAKFFAITKRAERIRIEPVDPSVYELTYNPRRRADMTDGIFGIDGATIPFRCHLHRPMPAETIVKKAVWSGRFFPHRKADKPGDKWEWHIQLTVEVPPFPPIKENGPVAGLDLGWRVMAEGAYLRIGMLADSEGQVIELRLPLLDTGASRYKKSKLLEKSRTWYDILEFDRQIGECVEDAKGGMRARLAKLPPSFDKMRQSGLRKFLRTLDEQDIENLHQRAAIRAGLEAWDHRERYLQRIKADLQERLLGRKRWLYQNLASWLTKRYRLISWEADLSIKLLAESHDNPAIANSMKYRQWAALGEFREYLKKAAKKNGCETTGPEGAFSTLQHWDTEEVLEKGNSAIELEWPLGGKEDQDKNSARNLLKWGLSQTEPEIWKKGSLKTYLSAIKKESLEITEVLRAVATPYS